MAHRNHHRPLRVACLLVLTIAFASTPAHASYSTTVSLSVDDIVFSQSNGYDILELPDSRLAGEPGSPLLPCMVLKFVIPQGQAATELTFDTESKECVPGTYNIYPSQPPLPSEANWGDQDFTEPDAEVYNSSLPFPPVKCQLGPTTSAWGWKICHVLFWPLEYIPAEKQVWLLDRAEIRINVSPSPVPDQEILPRSREQHDCWVEEMSAMVVNPNDVEPLAPDVFGPVALSRRWILLLPGYPQPSGRDSWYDAFSPLIALRQSQGLDVEVEYAGHIMTGSGEEAVLDIREYLRYQHAYCGARWACLVGDSDIIPWTHYADDGYGGYWDIANDWCYCDLDGPWPEYHDWSPEIWAGRVPCVTPMEGQNYVAKVLTYEQTPGGDDQGYFTRAFYEDLTSPCCETVMEHQDPQMDDTLLVQEGDPPSFPHDTDVVDAIKTVHFNLVTVYSHGFSDVYWTMESGDDDRLFGLDDIEQLWNDDGHYYSFWYSTPCYNGDLDATNRTIAEAAVCMYPQTCAVAFAGNTRLGKWMDSARLQWFAWDLLFPQGPLTTWYFNQAGHVEAMSKHDHFYAGYYIGNPQYARFSHNLFGDPALPIWCPRDLPSTQYPPVGDICSTETSDRLLICSPLPIRTSARLHWGYSTSQLPQISVYDLAGRLVLRSVAQVEPHLNNNLVLDLSQIPNGTYFLKITTSDSNAVAKAVVLR